MYFRTTLTALVACLLTGVHSCEQGGMYCQWYGEAPSCGSSNFSWGDYDGDEKLVATTKWHNIHQLLHTKDINKACYDEYGGGCVWGYKRLWCKKTPYSLADEESVSRDSINREKVLKHPHQKETIKIEIELN
ncbi:hypothetical protein VTL71DRAFT_8787 [Oculimacula yallundae]|uniref:Uncharacterized protein n=1 Tax=Oculimacula yallundae TaxID=86028 RepID=A0ABR4CYR1_9HELO